MFTFMNTARIGTAIQGVGPAELSYQNALAYAKERRSMRALSGKKEPDQVADSLIYHADVRRMLLIQKAVAEGGRAMLYDAAQYADHMVCGYLEEDEKKIEQYDDKLGFLTPILKGFLTEMGCEATNLGMQVFGGHGYIKEHGMEQIVRDTRIATLYEGTTGIQALDLLGRKTLLMTQGGAVRDFTLRMSNFARKHLSDKAVRPYCWRLLRLAAQWNWLTLRLMVMARKDRDVVSSAANDFLMYSGYVYMAFMWARMAVAAQKGLREGGDQSAEFYRAKLATAEFYFERMLPRAQGHAESMLSPSDTLMKLDNDHFSFDYWVYRGPIGRTLSLNPPLSTIQSNRTCGLLRYSITFLSLGIPRPEKSHHTRERSMKTRFHLVPLLATSILYSPAWAQQSNTGSEAEASPFVMGGNEFNPAISVILDGIYGNFSRESEAPAGFGEGHEEENGDHGHDEHGHGVEEGFQLRETELAISGAIDPTWMPALPPPSVKTV